MGASHVTAHTRTAVLHTLDATMFAAGSLAAVYSAQRAGDPRLPIPALLGFAAVLFPLLSRKGLYRHRLQAHALDDARSFLVALTLSAMAIFSLAELLNGSGNSGFLVREWVFVGVLLLAGRTALQGALANAFRAGKLLRPTLIVGCGRVGTLIARRLQAHPDLGLAPVGFLDNDPLQIESSALDLPVLGANCDLERVVEERNIAQVVVAFSTVPDDVLLRLIRRCQKLDLDVSFVSRFYEDVSEGVKIEHLGGLSLLTPCHVDPRGWQFAVKYALDRLVAALLLVLLAPVFALAALAVRLRMGRPLFFRQQRIGRDGKPFQMLKFRSMRCSGEDEPPFVLPEGLGPGGIEGADRTTTLGRILRDTNIDELPQLVNVLRGEMSIVGPRPERPEYVERFAANVYRYSDRHRVKAGITGWAQVSGLRGRTSIADRAEWDNYYVQNFSLWLDLKIILQTAAMVIRGLILGPLKRREDPAAFSETLGQLKRHIGSSSQASRR
jgi:exopolysaccharide biosynthesis polyprenyl glycosylphosphotransferase